ncbi:MAG: hypothetical protein BZY88_01010, partial [SAR202 cluster bacterium Io17-Chloro-G9]
MDYSQSINLLLSMVDHERTGPGGPRQRVIPDLGRMTALLSRLGNPQNAAAGTIHITGTKGKGSTAALCDAALRAGSYTTGFYSSPHLHHFRERIRLDSQPIEEDQFAALVEQVWPAARWVSEDTDQGFVTLFEFMTAMAFQCYAGAAADFQTIEVGLGGRLDATNVVRPDVCVITSISLDHTAILGNTIAEIAADKAGIIKPGASVVIGPQRPEALSVILEVCRELRIEPIQVGRDVTWEGGPSTIGGQRLLVRGRLDQYRLDIPLLGRHQLENAATAVAALEALRERGHAVLSGAIRKGFDLVSWPCRMEPLSQDPLVVADGAHNVYAMETLLESMPQYFDYDRLLLVVGFSRDKNVVEMVDRLAKAGDLVFATRSRHPRSLAP